MALIMDKLRALRNTPTRTLIAVFKGALAFIILDILALSTRVRSGFHYPITLTSATVVVIAGFPGANYGQVIAASATAFGGIGLGAVAFLILAKLAHVPVAQGIVFVIVLYLFSIMKGLSMKFFGFALLGILVSFAGIYTSLLLPGHPFSPHYLEDYLKAYALGGAVVLAVNFLILPISSETELRRTLVTSLGHIKTFSHLLAKSYLLTITEEEVSVRNGLAQSVRADFGILQQKLATTTVEINWSKLGMEDYRSMIETTHKLQQDLIGLYSTVVAAEAARKAGDATTLFRSAFLPNTKVAFTAMRKEISVVICEICKVLGEGINVDELPEYEDFRENFDTEAGTAPQRRHTENVRSPLDKGLRRQLDREIGMAPTPVHGRSPAPTRRQSMTTLHENAMLSTGDPTKPLASPSVAGSGDGNGSASKDPNSDALADLGRRLSMSTLVASHIRFRNSQADILSDLLVSGRMAASDSTLRVEQHQPSWAETFSAERERQKKSRIEDFNRRTGRLEDDVGSSEQEKKEKDHFARPPGAIIDPLPSDLRSGDANLAPEDESRLLLTMTSVLWLTGQFVKDLDSLHKHVTFDIASRTRSRLHVHIAEKPKKPTNDVKSLPMYKALAILEGRTPVRPKVHNLGTRLRQVESLLRSDASLGALKTAAAAIAFTSILLAPSSRQFFIDYSLTGGVLSVVVAMSPSLGQTLFTFINQAIGVTGGSVYGMILLYIFRDVGGYRHNPYGIICLLIPFALGLSWIIYTKPAMFALGLLALNSANVVIFTIIFYEGVPTFRDSPALRVGKALVSMCIALSIAFAFQYLINRAPARKLLREGTADLMASVSAYYILHAAYVAALNVEAETLDGRRPPADVIQSVAEELGKRERAIQAELIALSPMMQFAKLEPDFNGPFRLDLYKKIIQGVQLLMDRLREARVIIAPLREPGYADEGAPQTLSVFAPMAAYRRFHNRLTKHRMYMLTTALQSKTPLPQDSLRDRYTPIETVRHDMLVLASRLSAQPGGEDAIRSTSFLRMLSYLLAMANAARTQIDVIEEAVGGLLGVLEEEEFL